MTVETKHPILIVDDEPEILFSLRGLLRRDFDVHAAGSGAEALKILHEQPIHLIMTDQRMPEMTGAELLKQAQGEFPEAIRIVFTGYADLKAVVDAINEGRIYRYLTKPWDPDELLEVLYEAAAHYQRAVEQRRLLSDVETHLADGDTLARSLVEKRFGELSAAGRAELEPFARRNSALYERVKYAATASARHPQGNDR